MYSTYTKLAAFLKILFQTVVKGPLPACYTVQYIPTGSDIQFSRKQLKTFLVNLVRLLSIHPLGQKTGQKGGEMAQLEREIESDRGRKVEDGQIERESGKFTVEVKKEQRRGFYKKEEKKFKKYIFKLIIS